MPKSKIPMVRAKRIMDEFKLTGVVIVGYDQQDNSLEVVTYGVTKHHCALMGKVGEHISNDFMAGRLAKLPEPTSAELDLAEAKMQFSKARTILEDIFDREALHGDLNVRIADLLANT